jgi:hypothetical protein
VRSDGTTQSVEIPSEMLQGNPASFYRSQYDYHGYGFDDKKDKSYFSGLPYPDDLSGEFTEDAWYLIVSLDDVNLSGTSEFKWGLTGSNYGVITNHGSSDEDDVLDFNGERTQRYLDIDIVEGFDGYNQTSATDILHGGEYGGYFRPIFSTKDGFWRETYTEQELSDYWALPMTAKNIKRNSITTWDTGRSQGTKALEKLFSKANTSPVYGSRGSDSRLGSDYNGLWHRNWGLHNTVRMAHAASNSTYECGETGNRCLGIYDYISPDGTQVFPCSSYETNRCSCDNGTVTQAYGCGMSSAETNTFGLSSWLASGTEYGLSNGYEFDDNTTTPNNVASIISEYNRQYYLGKYWYGKSTTTELKDYAVPALRAYHDDRSSSGSNQPCPFEYCKGIDGTTSSNYIYPNPPFMSPWYLPSADEMAWISRMIVSNELNEKILAKEGSALSGHYWTSTGAYKFKDFTTFHGATSEIVGQRAQYGVGEGLLYSGITGSGITFQKSAKYVGLTLGITASNSSSNEYLSGYRFTNDELSAAGITGNMSRAWVQIIPSELNVSTPGFGFATVMRDKTETAKVRAVRLMRVDGRYPLAGYDRLNSSNAGNYIDANARLWYMPYLRVGDNRYHFNWSISSNQQEDIYDPKNIFDLDFIHRDYLAPEAGDPQQGLTSRLTNHYGSCDLPSGNCILTKRYKCETYYGGAFGGEGSRCYEAPENYPARPTEKSGIEFLEDYYKGRRQSGGSNQSSSINNRRTPRSGGMGQRNSSY